MYRPVSVGDYRGREFILRLFLAYFAVPLTGPALFVLQALCFGGRVSFRDALGVVLIYGVFGFVAMLVLGSPLLFLYSRLQWTGFPAFIGGGAFCAALMYSLVARDRFAPAPFVFFTLFGVVEGLALRLMLFGFSARRERDTERSSAGPHPG